MKRYLAFAGDYAPQQNLQDFLSDHDELIMAKRAVDVRDPQGFPTYEWGCVLDTKLGQVHDWTQSGADEWRFPRNL